MKNAPAKDTMRVLERGNAMRWRNRHTSAALGRKTRPTLGARIFFVAIGMTVQNGFLYVSCSTCAYGHAPQSAIIRWS